jgi:hypothetical protein
VGVAELTTALICVGDTKNNAAGEPPMLTVTPPSVAGGCWTSGANATPVASFVPNIVMMLPGATLTADSDAALTTLKFWAGRMLETTHNSTASGNFFIDISRLRSRSLTVCILLAIVRPFPVEIRLRQRERR